MSPQQQVFGGEEGLAAYNEAMDACRRFAKVTGCPLGVDVSVWLNEKTYEYHQAVVSAHRKAG